MYSNGQSDKQRADATAASKVAQSSRDVEQANAELWQLTGKVCRDEAELREVQDRIAELSRTNGVNGADCYAAHKSLSVKPKPESFDDKKKRIESELTTGAYALDKNTFDRLWDAL